MVQGNNIDITVSTAICITTRLTFSPAPLNHLQQSTLEPP